MMKIIGSSTSTTTFLFLTATSPFTTLVNGLRCKGPEGCCAGAVSSPSSSSFLESKSVHKSLQQISDTYEPLKKLVEESNHAKFIDEGKAILPKQKDIISSVSNLWQFQRQLTQVLSQFYLAFKSQHGETEGLNKATDDLNAKLAQLGTKFGKVDAGLDQLKGKVESNTENQDKLTNVVSDVAKDTNILKQDVVAAQDSAESVKGQIKQTSDAISNINENINKNGAKIVQTKAELGNEILKKTSDINSHLIPLEQRVSHLSDTVGGVTGSSGNENDFSGGDYNGSE